MSRREHTLPQIHVQSIHIVRLFDAAAAAVISSSSSSSFECRRPAYPHYLHIYSYKHRIYRIAMALVYYLYFKIKKTFAPTLPNRGNEYPTSVREEFIHFHKYPADYIAIFVHYVTILRIECNCFCF